jgi:hypothetical protein
MEGIQPMRWPTVLLLGFSLSWLAAGCRNNDLVEAELRSRDTDVRDLRADLARAEGMNEALMRELSAVRQGTSSKITPELASQTYTLKKIVLGRGTGGLDVDGLPGDEALQLILQPQDVDDHTIKAPGSLHVEAAEISAEGLKTFFSAWDVTPEQLRRTWHSGLLSTGYVITLPWKNWPSSEKLRITARFTLLDGRVFEADKDITIHLGPPPHGKSVGPPMPVFPENETPLGMPRLESKPPTLSPISASFASSNGRAASWRAPEPPSIADSIELLRPAPLLHPPGQNPGW